MVNIREGARFYKKVDRGTGSDLHHVIVGSDPAEGRFMASIGLHPSIGLDGVISFGPGSTGNGVVSSESRVEIDNIEAMLRDAGFQAEIEPEPPIPAGLNNHFAVGRNWGKNSRRLVVVSSLYIDWDGAEATRQKMYRQLRDESAGCLNPFRIGSFINASLWRDEHQVVALEPGEEYVLDSFYRELIDVERRKYPGPECTVHGSQREAYLLSLNSPER